MWKVEALEASQLYISQSQKLHQSQAAAPDVSHHERLISCRCLTRAFTAYVSCICLPCMLLSPSFRSGFIGHIHIILLSKLVRTSSNFDPFVPHSVCSLWGKRNIFFSKLLLNKLSQAITLSAFLWGRSPFLFAWTKLFRAAIASSWLNLLRIPPQSTIL